VLGFLCVPLRLRAFALGFEFFTASERVRFKPMWKDGPRVLHIVHAIGINRRKVVFETAIYIFLG
jgi:hypothetical protein